MSGPFDVDGFVVACQQAPRDAQTRTAATPSRLRSKSAVAGWGASGVAA
jgi:hypothetical protein